MLGLCAGMREGIDVHEARAHAGCCDMAYVALAHDARHEAIVMSAAGAGFAAFDPQSRGTRFGARFGRKPFPRDANPAVCQWLDRECMPMLAVIERKRDVMRRGAGPPCVGQVPR